MTVFHERREIKPPPLTDEITSAAGCRGSFTPKASAGAAQ